MGDGREKGEVIRPGAATSKPTIITIVFFILRLVPAAAMRVPARVN